MGHVDILIVTALPMEFEAARSAALSSGLGHPGVARWAERSVNDSTPYLLGDFLTADGSSLTVALARPVRVGGRAAAPITTTLTDQLMPTCLAMCGVCAGNPERTSPGDVVVADVVYEYDEGHHIEASFYGDHRHYPLDTRWLRAVQDFDPTRLPSYGEAGMDEGRNWFLECLYLKQQPAIHPARSRYLRGDAWPILVEQMQSAGLIMRRANSWSLTEVGASLVEAGWCKRVDGPLRLPYAVIGAPMASGSAVIEDAAIWSRLKAMGVYRVAALEMEAATIATIAHERNVPHWLVAKGVMDRADPSKDDRYKAFAARASAEVIFSLLADLVPHEKHRRKIRRADSSAEAFPAILSQNVVERPADVARSPTFTLPARNANFTGRDAELNRIVDAVLESASGGRVFGIHAIGGMAGVGKTTLAVEIGHLLSGVFIDGQLFVDLKGHTAGQAPTTPTEALAQLISAEGVAPQHLPATLDERAAMWRALVGRRRVLLILDNAADSSQVHPLLPGSPESLVIVTSRRALADLGAVSVALDTLPVDEARQMFVRLSPRAAAEPDQVDELLRMCGYLPLAISLLAGILNNRRSWTVENLVDEAREGLLHIKAENRTVAAAFELSYRGQNAEMQRFFRLLGLHPGVTVEPRAAAALTGVSIESARLRLDRLSDEYLMSESAYRRYRMHDLVREYVRGLAAEVPVDERESALKRILDFYQISARSANAHFGRHALSGEADASTPRMTDYNAALAWMNAEIGNVKACVELAWARGESDRVVALTAAIARYLRRAGPWDEAVALHTNAVAAARLLNDNGAQVSALTELGTIHRQRGDYPSAIQSFNEAIELGSALQERHGLADILVELATARHLSGDYQGASGALDEALAVYRESRDRLGEAAALAEAGVVYRVLGDSAKSMVALTRALTAFRDEGDSQGEANALANLGLVRWVIGDVRNAITDLESARTIFVDRGDQIGEADSLHYLGIARTTAAELQQAELDILSSLTICDEIRYRHGEAGALVTLGEIQALKGDNARSNASYRRAHAIYADLGNLHGQCRSLVFRARGYRASGDFGRAKQALNDSERICRELDNRHIAAVILELRGCLACDEGDYVKSLDILDEALHAYRSAGDKRLKEASALNERGKVLRRLGRIAESKECHEQALTIAEAVGWPLQQARSLEGIGRCENELGHMDRRDYNFSKAMALYEVAAPGELARLAKEGYHPGKP